MAERLDQMLAGPAGITPDVIQKQTDQDIAVDALVARGFTVTRGAWGDGTVYLAKRDRKIRSLTHLAEVDEDGFVNGEPWRTFVRSIQ